MAALDLVLCVHLHLPVGDLDAAFEEVGRDAWAPLLEALERRPRARCALHVSGAVLDWLALRHPEHLDRLRALARHGRVEPITGGHYEPALPALPEVDRIGQVRRLSDALERVTGRAPETLWLAGGAWEPHLPPALEAAGVRGVVLPDALFAAAGLPPGPRPDYYLTEDLGRVVALFPALDWLDAAGPAAEPAAVLSRLREALAGARAAGGGPPLAVLAVSARAAPFDAILAALESAGWLETVTFAEHRRRAAPAGRVYLAAAPATSWRATLARSPGADALHKKMLRVSRKVDAATRRDPDRAAPAREALYRGQCHDAYGPPEGGGVAAHVRSAAFRNLVAAERVADEVLAATRPGPLRAFPWGGEVRGPCVLETDDLDADGAPEVAVESPLATFFVDPARGGGVPELDVRARAFNLLDTGRPAFVEHFLGRETGLDAFAAGGHDERGAFCGSPYEWTVLEAPPVAESEIPSEPEPEPPRVRLARRAAVRGEGGATVPVLVAKTLHHDGSAASVTAAYLVQNEGTQPLETTFAVEVSLNLVAGRAPDRYYRLPGVDLPADERHLGSRGAVAGVTAVEVVDEWLPLTVRLACDEPAEWWRFPLDARGQAQRGSVLLLGWPLRLEPGERFRVRVSLSAS